ncbi:hypothetical protein [Streptosporangium sp. NPDC049046]|uniref:hypothetical protein n=1 Tax=Streptosporangium sp. NPDC049046 TaxID=3155031 RepID=UPI00341E8D07
MNAAIFFAPDQGAISDVTVSCNVLYHAPGSYYPLRIYDVSGAVKVTGNRWVPDGIDYAPVHVTGPRPATVTWSDNTFTGNKPIPPPTTGPRSCFVDQ